MVAVDVAVAHRGPRGALKRRIEEATKFTDLDRLCLSPQCGFASTEEGNILAVHEQWAKLRLIEIAEETSPSRQRSSFSAAKRSSFKAAPAAFRALPRRRRYRTPHRSRRQLGESLAPCSR
jgi:hypothetical protein